jgi:hypothetical protein
LTAAAVLVKPMWALLILVAVALLIPYGVTRRGAWLVMTVVLVVGAGPLVLWEKRNIEQAGFHGISDISGKTVWRGLAARVRAELTGQNRFAVEDATLREDSAWPLSVEAAHEERWRRARDIFQAHPFLTVACFVVSAAEHMAHPSPDVLAPVKLNFRGDYWVLGGLWAAMVLLAGVGLLSARTEGSSEAGSIDRGWLMMFMAITFLLTLTSGMAFGAGSRYRASLETIIPILTGAGLVRVSGYARRLGASDNVPYHDRAREVAAPASDLGAASGDRGALR